MIDPRTYYKAHGFTEAAKAVNQIAEETGGMFYLAYRIEKAVTELRKLEPARVVERENFPRGDE